MQKPDEVTYRISPGSIMDGKKHAVAPSLSHLATAGRGGHLEV